MYSSNKTVVGGVATIFLFLSKDYHKNIINQKGQTLNILTII